jgi:oligoendopeptidase F
MHSLPRSAAEPDSHSGPGSTLRTRQDVPASDCWDLSKLYGDDAAWEKALERYRDLQGKIPSFKGTLGQGAETLAAALCFLRDFGVLEERLAAYASLREAEDQGLAAARDRSARLMMTQAEAQTAWSYFDPEIQAIPDDRMASYLAHPALAEFAIWLRKLLRFRPHILSEKEERLLAMQIEANQTVSNAFTVLTDVDFDFGSLDTPDGSRPLSHASFSSFMQSPDRDLRRRAYDLYYAQFDRHKTTLGVLYEGSVQLDRYAAKVRNHASARAMALFPDDMPEAVYDNLVATVNAGLPVLHRYYEIRRRALQLDELRHYDVRVPLMAGVNWRHSYDQAVDVVCQALAPLGDGYGAELRRGLRHGWVDRYENKGKHSGAFSYGCYGAEPYILMNFKEDLLDDLFTLAHEAGHSMHSYYSARSNPFLNWHYTTFEAEVASTFNEQLMQRHLIDHSESAEIRAYLINKEVDAIVSTLFRQTMFAEFEARAHALVESGTPLTVEVIRAEYGTLLARYFGPAMKLEAVSDLEALRIPHFYRAFYVYTYATGISAAIALADRVLTGGERARDDYFTFLRSGGSRYPIAALKLAGVDMSSPAPIQAALARFNVLVGELAKVLHIEA